MNWIKRNPDVCCAILSFSVVVFIVLVFVALNHYGIIKMGACGCPEIQLHDTLSNSMKYPK